MPPPAGDDVDDADSASASDDEVLLLSAVSFVRDFAYPDFHPLHLGLPPAPRSPTPSSHSRSSSHGGGGGSGLRPNGYYYSYDDDKSRSSSSAYPQGGYDDRDDGPPWAEDSYLTSPVIATAASGDREYYFSVASEEDEIHGRAVALFDFEPENENEFALKEGQNVWISYRHGQGWLVAQDPVTGESGLVPEQYVEIIQRDAFRAPQPPQSQSQQSTSVGGADSGTTIDLQQQQSQVSAYSPYSSDVPQQISIPILSSETSLPITATKSIPQQQRRQVGEDEGWEDVPDE
ncbi:uncharacterized protein V1518DRAFT_412465 [Limtongia smithiae]|uniref:uncharacterized protein n=1 Tax=Limtongia smithiae TaxID=1125753 RepID=UPI0034CE0FD3